MGRFVYVYILKSRSSPERYYVGYTTDLKARLRDHNRGHVRHTSKFIPWDINTAIAFTVVDRALAFERYLKSASGRAFSRRRL